ncbi:hypothetical protein P7C70_g3375, partial [Phenoliferia sp. Uapishka_3]
MSPTPSLLASLLALSTFAAVNGQLSFPSPTLITGDGPRPPVLSSAAPTGTWTAPTTSVVVSGTTFAPPSVTGVGKQAQIIGADNFCLYMPPDPTTENLVDAEAIAVAYCINPYNDTRPMPDGFIRTAHFRQTPDYVQITGTFDWTKMNINPYDCGGEYDNHGAEGLGNPVGAHVDGGDNWSEFMGSCDTPGEPGQFCFRSCHGDPGDYQQEGFTNCQADSDLPVGVYNSSYTFAQGQSFTPPAVAAPSSSSCVTVASPTASGVTYSWDQLAYETSGVSSGAASTASSSGSSAKSASGSAAATSTGKSSAGRTAGGGNGWTGVVVALGAVAGVMVVMI